MIVGVGKRGTGSGVARWREVHGSIHPRNRGARGALGRVRAFHSIQSTCSPALHVFFFTASLDGTLDRSSGSNPDQKPELSSFCFFLLDRLGSGIRLFTVYSWNGTSHHESNPSIMHSPAYIPHVAASSGKVPKKGNRNQQ